MIDATWKCWHCLAVDQGKHYGDIIGAVRELFFHHPYAQGRLEVKRAKALHKSSKIKKPVKIQMKGSLRKPPND